MKVNFIQNKELEPDVMILQASKKDETIESIIYDIESRIAAIECILDGKKQLQSIESFSRFV